MKSFIKYLFVLVILIPATLATFIPYLFDIYIKLAMLFPSTLYSSILLIDHSDEGNFIFWFLKFYRPVVEAFSFYTLAAHLPDHLSEFIFKFNLIIKFALVIGWITLGYDFYLNHKFLIINFISQTNSIAFKKYGEKCKLELSDYKSLYLYESDYIEPKILAIDLLHLESSRIFDKKHKWNPGSSGFINIVGGFGTVTPGVPGWSSTEDVPTGFSDVKLYSVVKKMYFSKKNFDYHDGELVFKGALPNEDASQIKQWIMHHRLDFKNGKKLWDNEIESNKILSKKSLCNRLNITLETKNSLDIFEYNTDGNINLFVRMQDNADIIIFNANLSPELQNIPASRASEYMQQLSEDMRRRLKRLNYIE